MKSSRCFRILFLAVAITLWGLPKLHAQNSVTSDFVVMLDVSGSISTVGQNGQPSDLELERRAVKQLIDAFAESSTIERVAIGTFNVKKTQDTGPFAQIRIHLTQDYTAIKSFLDGISSTEGYTDLSEAVSVAQAELTGSTATQKFIIVISDGMTNRPCPLLDPKNPNSFDFDRCLVCGHEYAFGLARSAAKLAKDSATNIISVYFQGHNSPTTFSCTQQQVLNGVNLLKDGVSSKNYFFDGTQSSQFGIPTPTATPVDPGVNLTPTPTPTPDLTGTIDQIACAVKCNDSDSCTIDSCDQAGKCVHAADNSDADNDGVPNCKDKCSGSDALLTTACQINSVGSCKLAGINVCGSENKIFCKASETASIDIKVCFGCSDSDQSGAVSLYAKVLAQQSGAVKSLLTHFKKVAGTGKKARAMFKSYSQVRLAADKSVADAIAQIPLTVSACSDTKSCQLLNHGVALDSVVSSSQSLANLSKKLSTRIRKLEGSLSRKDRAAIALAKSRLIKAKEISSSFARVSSSCV